MTASAKIFTNIRAAKEPSSRDTWFHTPRATPNDLSPLPSWERSRGEGGDPAALILARTALRASSPSPLAPLPQGERGSASPPPTEQGARARPTPAHPGTAPLLDPDLPALVGAAGWARLAPDIRRRFACGHGVKPVAYEGRMRIERSAFGLLFALAAKLFGGPLPIRTSPDAAACVTVSSDGRGGVVWRRALTFAPGQLPLVVRSTKRRDAKGQLLECVDGGLGMRLRVFEEQGALVFESLSYFLHVGPFRLPIPAIATPGVCRVAHTDEGGDRFRFTLTFTHPLWGRTFIQDGVFADPEHAPRTEPKNELGEA